MALNIRTQVVSSIADAETGISIGQNHTFTDAPSETIENLNFTMGTVLLPATSDWIKIDRGDIDAIREIYIVLNGTPQDENIGMLISDVADPNSPVADPTFLMRETFTATTDIPGTVNIWIKNLGTVSASLTVILGGSNA